GRALLGQGRRLHRHHDEQRRTDQFPGYHAHNGPPAWVHGLAPAGENTGAAMKHPSNRLTPLAGETFERPGCSGQPLLPNPPREGAAAAASTHSTRGASSRIPCAIRSPALTSTGAPVKFRTAIFTSSSGPQ